MRRLAVTTLALAVLAAPATADATTTKLYSGPNYIYTPSLADSRVLFGESQAAGAARVAILPAAGGTPTTLATAEPKLAHAGVGVTYGGSDTRVFVQRVLELGGASLLTGPPAGLLTSLEDCDTSRDYEFAAPGPVVDGDLAAWAGAECKEQRVRIQTGDTSRIIDAGDFIHAIAAGGRYVAWLRMVRPPDPATPLGTRLVVVDSTTGDTAYSADVPPSTNVDVEPDGTAVISTYAPGGTPPAQPCHGGTARFIYFTLTEPVAHDVPGTNSCEGLFRVAGGRLAFVDHLGGNRHTLTITDLTGVPRQDVVRLDGLPPVASFDFDASHVAWTQTRCRDYAMFIRDASDTSAAGPAITCPVKVGKPRLSRDRTVHVPVSCPNGCRSPKGQGMTFVSPHWLHAWSKTISNAPYRAINVRPGGHVTLHLPTTARQRALIRRRRPVAVRIKIVAQNIYLPRIPRTLF